MIEVALQQYIVADPALVDLVANRIYPVVWPDAPVFPLVTYQRISTVTDSVLSGPLALCTVRVQYDVYAKSYLAAKDSATALNNVLEGYSGTLPDGTTIANVSLDSAFDLYDSQSLSYRVSSDYLVTYTRQ